MLKEFEQHIAEQFPFLGEQPFLLACSGGIDSVVLAHLCAEAEMDFALAHCNFHLRGKASKGDEKSVAELAKKLEVKFYVTHFNTITYVNKNKVSVQMAARELRYAWFAEVMQENSFSFLVTAHNSDDQLETFLINLSRGTGIDGLTGIPAQTEAIARPLLRFSRAQILAYAREQNISWREDASNSDTRYLRSKIRLEVVPALKALHPSFTDNFKKTQHFLAGTAAILETHINDLRHELFIHEPDSIKIEVASLKVLKPLKPYMHALFRHFGFTEWDDVAGLLTATSGKEVSSRTHRLIKDREYLLLQEIRPDTDRDREFFLDDSATTLPVKFAITEVDQITETSDAILYIDKETLNDRLYVRKWRNGDYFYPLGMKGRKKLSKFFKDEKLDTISKEKQWLLCSGADIVWVMGRRADQRFSVTPGTRNILKFTLLQ